jgi:hypothetical protein
LLICEVCFEFVFTVHELQNEGKCRYVHISSEIRMLVEQAEQRLILDKSKQMYNKEYEKLSNWMASKNYNVVDETLMLANIYKMVGNN